MIAAVAAGQDRGQPGAGGPRRVVVTRPAEQAAELCARLQEAGFVPVRLPAIAVRQTADTAALDGALRALDRLQWVVFPSANSARCFVERLPALGLEPAACAHLRLVAGPRTAVVLEAAGLRPTVVSPFSAADALRAMAPAVAPGARVLIVRAAAGDDSLTAGLQRSGAIVDEVVAYQTHTAPAADASVIADLAHHGAGAVTFFSPSAVRGLADLLRPAHPDLLAWLRRDALAVSIGPTTDAAAAADGWQTRTVAPATTAAAVVSTLQRHVAAQEARAW